MAGFPSLEFELQVGLAHGALTEVEVFAVEVPVLAVERNEW